jgi:hypothetical protein
MTVEAFGLQDYSAGESAEKARRWVSALLQRGSTIGSALGGLVAATDLQVTYQGAGLKIEVAQGEAFVGANMVSPSQGAYYCRNTAAASVTLPAANASNPRIERVCLVVYDESYEGTKNEAKLEVLAGTASAGATLANLTGVAAAPKSSMTLAYVLVPAAATTISNADIKNVASRVLGSLVQLAVVIAASNVTAQYGQLIESSGPITVKLPAAAGAVSQRVGAAAGGGAVTVECVNGELIYGDFLQGVTSCSLAVRQHVEFTSDGLNWLIVAGAAGGAWTEMTGLNGKVAAGEPVEARAESLSGRIYGGVQVKSGQSLTAGETLFTLPSVLHPAKQSTVATTKSISGSAASAQLVVRTNGEVLIETACSALENINLDCTYPLT